MRDGIRACDVFGRARRCAVGGGRPFSRTISLVEDLLRFTAMPIRIDGHVWFLKGRSAIVLLPLQIKVLNFQGGAGAYTQSIWRPRWGKIGQGWELNAVAMHCGILTAGCNRCNTDISSSFQSTTFSVGKEQGVRGTRHRCVKRWRLRRIGGAVEAAEFDLGRVRSSLAVYLRTLIRAISTHKRNLGRWY